MISTGVLSKIKTEARNANEVLDSQQTDSFAYTDGIDEFSEYVGKSKHEIGFAQKRSSMTSLK